MTAFVSCKTTFNILPRGLRARVRDAPHPYVWMSLPDVHSMVNAIESQGKKIPLDKLPSRTEDKIKVFPIVRSLFSPRVTSS